LFLLKELSHIWVLFGWRKAGKRTAYLRQTNSIGQVNFLRIEEGCGVGTKKRLLTQRKGKHGGMEGGKRIASHRARDLRKKKSKDYLNR